MVIPSHIYHRCEEPPPVGDHWDDETTLTGWLIKQLRIDVTVWRMVAERDRQDVSTTITVHGAPLAGQMLADLEAKLRIVDWCGTYQRIQMRGGFVESARERDFAPGELAHPADSVVLRYLALPYVGRPGYRDDWRPEPQPTDPRFDDPAHHEHMANRAEHQDGG